jgi:mannose-1-phosphate guanylyltransferase
MRLGLDIDGTITAEPVFFREFASTVIKNGGEVQVVTSRSPEARITAAHLKYGNATVAMKKERA